VCGDSSQIRIWDFAFSTSMCLEASLFVKQKVGTMLPCNVVAQEQPPQRVEAAAVDPVASMMAIDNPDLQVKAAAVRRRRPVSMRPVSRTSRRIRPASMCGRFGKADRCRNADYANRGSLAPWVSAARLA
jgi:hypothetical protein